MARSPAQQVPVHHKCKCATHYEAGVYNRDSAWCMHQGETLSCTRGPWWHRVIMHKLVGLKTSNILAPTPAGTMATPQMLLHTFMLDSGHVNWGIGALKPW